MRFYGIYLVAIAIQSDGPYSFFSGFVGKVGIYRFIVLILEYTYLMICMDILGRE